MNSKNNTNDNNYLNQLTWLRGLAAFFVIVSHSLRATEVKYLPEDEVVHSLLFSTFDLGGFGVVLFFALSGCTLYISNANKVGLNSLLSFYNKRFFRIWPAFVVALIFYICFRYFFSLWYVEPQNHWIEKQFLSSYSLYDLLSYLSFTFNITGPSGLFNNAFWSLPAELQYYLIFPILIVSLRWGVAGPIIIGIFIYLIPKFGINFNDNTVFMLAYSFAGGIVIGYLYKKNTFRFSARLGLILLCTMFTLISFINQSIIPLPNLPIVSNIWNWFAIAGVLSVCIVIFTKIELNSKLARFLQHYGTISYSTYLYHNLFIGLAVLLLIQFNITDGYQRLLFTFFFTCITSYYIAGLSYKYIEKPFIALGKKIKL